MLNIKRYKYAGVAGMFLMASAYVSAESTGDDGYQVSSSSNRLLEEVVVTARKRTESAQDVPISITAFSSDKLDAIGIETAQQLDKITPGLVFGSTIGFTTVSLRGVGSDAYLPSADPSVPIYVDDINSLPSQGSVDALVNVERVEVLKGPQGTLFGRNALGGAIRIVTPEPNDEVFGGQVKFDVGRYEEMGSDSQSGSLFLNIPLADGLAATVSALYRDEEPFYKNELGAAVESNMLKAGRVKLKWYVTDTLDITLSGAYEEASNAGGLTADLYGGPRV
jgi:iron complex outermembrane recepter protein